MKKKLLTILQLEIALGVITFFVVQMYANGQTGQLVAALQRAAGHWPLLALGILLFSVCLTLCNLRWKTLLTAQGIQISFSRSMMLYMVGQFFSSFMPGATSGDVFKAIYIAREAPDKKTEAVATVFIDRIIGLLALVALTSVITAVRLDFFLSNPKTKAVMVFNLVLLLGMAAGLALVFGQNMFEKIPLFRKLEEKTALGKIIAKLYSAFHICIKSPAVLLKTIGLSLANHITLVFIAVCFGKSMGVDLPIIDYFTVFPIINAVAAIPATPGGLGTREAAAVFMLGLLGVAQPIAFSISILIYVATIFWSAVGGIVYLFYILKQGKPDLNEAEVDITAL